MKRVQIIGKVTLKRGVLYIITVVHDSRPDIAIFEDLYEAIFELEIENHNKIEYREIVKRKRVQKANGGTIYQSSQYTVLFTPTDSE